MEAGKTAAAMQAENNNMQTQAEGEEIDEGFLNKLN